MRQCFSTVLLYVAIPLVSCSTANESLVSTIAIRLRVRTVQFCWVSSEEACVCCVQREMSAAETETSHERHKSWVSTRVVNQIWRGLLKIFIYYCFARVRIIYHPVHQQAAVCRATFWKLHHTLGTSGQIILFLFLKERLKQKYLDLVFKVKTLARDWVQLIKQLSLHL